MLRRFRLLKTAALLTLLVMSVLFASPAYAQLAPLNKDGLTYGQVAVNVRDIDAQKKVWVETFEGVVVQKGPVTAIKWPGMLLILNQAESAGPSQGDVMDHFGFKVKSTANFVAKS